jgi:hypothetical protein
MTYGVFWPDTKKYGPNDLPLMKALHGENVDEWNIYQNYKKKQVLFVIMLNL